MSAIPYPGGSSSKGALTASLASWSLLAGVAVAFADSSIVVLALPDLLRQFDVSITSVAWTITAYNVALAAVAYALARLAASGRLRPTGIARTGATLFLAASLACAVAPGIATLIAFRTVQGVGAACLLVGSLPMLRASAASPARATALWVGAGVFGAAFGPAAGGFLTQIFSWHAIFLAQAPIAAVALIGTLRRYDEEAIVAGHDTRPRSQRLRAALTLMLASAALVGLLFLSVILLIDVWRFSPLVAAAIVTTIPAATFAAQPFVARLEGAGAAGGVLLAGGLLAMALLPARSVAWAIAALSLAGLGIGMLLPRLTRGVLASYGSPVEGGARTVWIRHAGLVAGLLILTPLLAGDLSAAGTSAKLRGISVVLDAPVSASTKLKLALDLAPALSRPARQGLPNFTATLKPQHDRGLTAIGQELDRVVQASVTRGFRRTFLVAALLGLLAVAPGVTVRRLSVFPRWSRVLLPAVAVSAVAALAGTEVASGAASFGERPRLLPPCAARPGVARTSDSQQLVLKALDVIACQLHEGREQLLANLAKSGRGEAKIVSELLDGGSLGDLGGLSGVLKRLLGSAH